ncbi:MAG: hypothetical protein E6G01_06815 [Actinobacteria bacterium]|nr:MAG: hypothetical protein E6G01_06815 [Actinomycetota bacterium]
MTTTELMRRLNESISGGRSFGPAFERDGCLVIPVALVLGGGGGGGGEPVEPGQAVEPETTGAGAGAQPSDRPVLRRPGQGGGFGLVSWPIGVYVVKDGEARWRPLVSAGDVGFLVLMLARLFTRSRRRRALARR